MSRLPAVPLPIGDSWPRGDLSAHPTSGRHLPFAVRCRILITAMPTILLWNGYRFFFFPNEGTPLEGRHVHIRKGAGVAKFWLDPEPSLVSSWGLAPKELSSLAQAVRDNPDLFRRKWDERFGS